MNQNEKQPVRTAKAAELLAILEENRNRELTWQEQNFGLLQAYNFGYFG